MAERKKFSKKTNPPMSAEDIRAFADDFAARASRISAVLHESAGLMDQASACAGDRAEIKPIASMWPQLLDRMEESALKQFRGKAKAELEVQRLLRNKRAHGN